MLPAILPSAWAPTPQPSVYLSSHGGAGCGQFHYKKYQGENGVIGFCLVLKGDFRDWVHMLPHSDILGTCIFSHSVLD